MKKLLIKSSLPLLTVMLAVGGVFASNLEKPGPSSVEERPGYRMDNCQKVEKKCTTVFNGNICTDGVPLRDSDCLTPLYEIPQN